MRISYPISNPTHFITIPDPDIRDQTAIKISTTFKRMTDGTVIPFQNTPGHKLITLTFSRLKYKKARQFLNFIINGNNQPMYFEGKSEFTEDDKQVIGTIVNDPYSLITVNAYHKALSITVCLQETITLSYKHIGGINGTQSSLKIDNSLFLIGGNNGSSLLVDTDEFAPFPLTQGYWVARNLLPSPNREQHSGFTINGEIIIVSGFDGSAVINQTNKFIPYFNAQGVWFAVRSSATIYRQKAVGLKISEAGLLIGGENNNTTLISCTEKFSNNSWSILTTPCYGIKNQCSFNTLRNYMVGGFDGGLVNQITEYDDLTSAFYTLATSALVKRENLQAGGNISQAKGAIFGGHDSSFLATTTNTIYNQVGASFSAGTVLPVAITNHSGTSIDTAVYSIGGETITPIIVTTNNEYDFLNNTWTAREPTLSPARKNSIAISSYLGGIPIPEDVVTIEKVNVPISSVTIFGGNIGAGLNNYSATNKTYEWNFGSISTKGDMPAAKSLQASGYVGDYIYAIDGVLSRNLPDKSFWKYKNNTWAVVYNNTLAAIAGTLGGTNLSIDDTSREVKFWATSDSFEDKIYIQSGLISSPVDYRNFSNRITSWNQLTGFKNEIYIPYEVFYGNSSAILDGAIYYVGGYQDYKPTPTTYGIKESSKVNQYVLQNSTYFKKTDLPPSGFVSSSASVKNGTLNINGKIFTFTSSYTFGGIQKKTMQYYPLTDSWAEMNPTPIQSLAAVSYAYANTSNGSKGATFGGDLLNDVKTDAILTYNESTNAWTTEVQVLPTATSQMSAEINQVFDDPSSTEKMFVAGGVTSKGLAGEVFIFDPLNNSLLLKEQPNGNIVKIACVMHTVDVGFDGGSLGPEGWMIGGSENAQDVTVNKFTFSGINCVSATGNWTKKTTRNLTEIPQGAPRGDMASALITDEIYLAMGYAKDFFNNDFTQQVNTRKTFNQQIHKFTPAGLSALGSWSIKNTRTNYGFGAMGANIADFFHILGGAYIDRLPKSSFGSSVGISSATSDFFVTGNQDHLKYNPVADTKVTMATINPPTSKSYGSFLNVGGNGYLIGYDDKGSLTKSNVEAILKFVPSGGSGGTWTTDKLTTGFRYTTSSVVNGYIYLVTGEEYSFGGQIIKTAIWTSKKKIMKYNTSTQTYSVQKSEFYASDGAATGFGSLGANKRCSTTF